MIINSQSTYIGLSSLSKNGAQSNLKGVSLQRQGGTSILNKESTLLNVFGQFNENTEKRVFGQRSQSYQNPQVKVGIEPDFDKIYEHSQWKQSNADQPTSSVYINKSPQIGFPKKKKESPDQIQKKLLKPQKKKYILPVQGLTYDFLQRQISQIQQNNEKLAVEEATMSKEQKIQKQMAKETREREARLKKGERSHSDSDNFDNEYSEIIENARQKQKSQLVVSSKQNMSFLNLSQKLNQPKGAFKTKNDVEDAIKIEQRRMSKIIETTRSKGFNIINQNESPQFHSSGYKLTNNNNINEFSSQYESVKDKTIYSNQQKQPVWNPIPNQSYTKIGDQDICVKDYGTQQGFQAYQEFEKYYINKQEYVIPDHVVSKGGDKLQIANKKLIAQRNQLKNRFTKQSNVDEYFKANKPQVKKSSLKSPLPASLRSSAKNSPSGSRDDQENILNVDLIQRHTSSLAIQLEKGLSILNMATLTMLHSESVTLSDDSVSDAEVASSANKKNLNKNLNIRHPNRTIKEVDEEPISVSSQNNKTQQKFVNLTKKSIRFNSDLSQRDIEQDEKFIAELIEYLPIVRERYEYQQSYDKKQDDINKLAKDYFKIAMNYWQERQKEDDVHTKAMQYFKKPESEKKKPKISKKNLLMNQLIQLQKVMEEGRGKISDKVVDGLLNPLNDNKERIKYFEILKPQIRDAYNEKVLKAERAKKFKIKRTKFAQEISNSKQDSSGEEANFLSEEEAEAIKNDLVIIDEVDQLKGGTIALLHQMQMYQQQKKLLNLYSFFDKTTKSPLLTFIQEVTSAGLSLKNYGFAHIKTKDVYTLDLTNNAMVKEYVQPFVKSLQLSYRIKHLILRNSKLKFEDSKVILAALPFSIELLDFSKNPNLGPKMIDFLEECILTNKAYSSLKQLNLEECGIGSGGCQRLCKALIDATNYLSLDILNLSANKIGKKGVLGLKEYLADPTHYLKTLVLHWNNIGPEGGIHIADALRTNKFLTTLDLSFCNLGRKRKQKVAIIESEEEEDEDGNVPVAPEPEKAKPENTGPLTEEQIEANQIQRIKQEKIQRIARDLRFVMPPNKKVFEIDLKGAQIWAKAFENNQNIIHLDLSYNFFDAKELTEINEGLNKNHTILGLHIDGNEGWLDPLGFIHPFHENGLILKEVEKRAMTAYYEGEGQFKHQPIKHVLVCGTDDVHQKLKYGKQLNNCWVCEGWTQYNFEYRPKQNIDVKSTPVNLHLSCDQFTAKMLDFYHETLSVDALGGTDLNQIAKQVSKKNQIQTVQKEVLVYQVFRMLPPTAQYFFFTVGFMPKEIEQDEIDEVDMQPLKTQAFLSPDHEFINLASNNKKARDVPSTLKKLKNVSITKINTIGNRNQCKDNINEEYLEELRAKPRPLGVGLAGRTNMKTPWDFFKSIFKTYKIDNQSSIDEIFEIDWANTKCEKILKSGQPGELEKTKDYLKSIYKYIRECYKSFSGIGAVGRLTCLSSSTVQEICGLCPDFVDNKTIKLADIDLQVIACNGGRKNNSFLSPDKNLVRHQLLEVLVRLAMDKYSIKVNGFYDSIEQAFEKHYLPFMKNFDGNQFRKQKLYREEMDVVFTRLQNGLDQVYKKYSGKYSTPARQIFTMSLDEWYDLLFKCELIGEVFLNKDVGPAFAMSMITNKFELDGDRHLNMSFVEFLEAIARVSDKYMTTQLFDNFPGLPGKNPFLLDKKVECVAFKIMKCCLSFSNYEQVFAAYKAKVDIEMANPSMKFSQTK